MKALLIGLVLMFAVPAWAGEKEELELKKQVLQERIAKNQAFIQLLTLQIDQAQKEQKEIEAKLKNITPKETKK